VDKIIYSAAEVHALCSAEAAIAIDIRPPAAYGEGHLPGAVNIHQIFTYLLTDSTPAGLAAMQATFGQLFSRAGVRCDRPVIFHDDNLASQYGGACRGYWLLTYLGHPRAGVMAGGLKGWLAAGLPIDRLVVQPDHTDFAPIPQPHLMATTDEVKKAIGDPSIILLDNRDEPEWLGLTSSPYTVDFAPRKGRIPGARWIEWYEFMNKAPHPAFKSPDEIRALCATRGITPEDDIIIYCFKGSRAAHTHVALKLAGFNRVRIYFGSWNEWARDPTLPISRQ